MMMENANNIAMERNTIFMMKNPKINANNKSTGFDFKCFTFDQRQLLRC
jgi:hypothetical protein